MRLSYSFFCILFSVFLNTSVYSQTNAVPAKKFVPPLLLCDYNSGTTLTNAGGISGGDEQKPGTTFIMIVNDDGLTRGNSGYSLRLDYDVSDLGEFSFYWIKLGREIDSKASSSAARDLTSYNYLSFWIKGAQEEGNIKVELHQDIDGDGVFVFGRDITSYVYTNGYAPSGAMTQNWQKVTIPLKKFTKITDWSKMLELVLVFENRAGNKKGILYIDDILFGYRPEGVLESRNTADLKAPLGASFKINGLKAKQCLAFNGYNILEINAQGASENPFIESVGFEYSTDQGNAWRVIGTDYDTGKNLYKVMWQPDNSRELYRYQVRAAAADIWGNEKPTEALVDCGVTPITDEEFLTLIQRKAFDFFNEHQNMKTGLFADTSGGGDASIASTGFGLAALCVGAEHKWITKEDARKRILLALSTFLPQKAGALEPIAEGRYGFFYHFLDMNTAKRAGRTEISTIDTAILVAGALLAGEYLGGDVKTKAEELYKRVEWEKFLYKEKGAWQNCFSMGWSPERGFLESYWDYYTDETILISLLAIGSPTHPVSPDVFYAWTRHKGPYEGGKPFIYSWHGSLFSYQYANIWFNFQNLVDREGIDWFENSTNATLANRQFCIDNADKFKGYGPNSWGVTSMARPEAYTMHFGTPPMGSGDPQYDGAISPTGPSGSIVFTPILSMAALKYMYITYPRLWGQYGLRDSYNLDLNWYAPTYYGIGVAMVLLPIENFRNGFIWKNFMKNRHIREALTKAGFTKAQKRRRAL